MLFRYPLAAMACSPFLIGWPEPIMNLWARISHRGREVGVGWSGKWGGEEEGGWVPSSCWRDYNIHRQRLSPARWGALQSRREQGPYGGRWSDAENREQALPRREQLHAETHPACLAFIIEKKGGKGREEKEQNESGRDRKKQRMGGWDRGRERLNERERERMQLSWDASLRDANLKLQTVNRTSAKAKGGGRGGRKGGLS